MLSDYQLYIMEDNLFLGKSEKLIPNVSNKKKPLHNQNVQLYLEMGLQLKKFIGY